jgi:hypothetical protein
LDAIRRKAEAHKARRDPIQLPPSGVKDLDPEICNPDERHMRNTPVPGDTLFRE